jgi:hypothetical protein
MERNHIINSYNQEVIDICLRCNDMLKPVWRIVRDRLRNFQVLNHNGMYIYICINDICISNVRLYIYICIHIYICGQIYTYMYICINMNSGKIMDSHFLNILKTEGVNISVWDSPRLCNAFRIFGMNDILDYSMFLRLCILLKLREKEIEDLYINDVDTNNDDNNVDNYGDNNNDIKIEGERD